MLQQSVTFLHQTYLDRIGNSDLRGHQVQWSVDWRSVGAKPLGKVPLMFVGAVEFLTLTESCYGYLKLTLVLGSFI